MSIIQKLIIGFYWRNGPGVTFYLKFLSFIRARMRGLTYRRPRPWTTQARPIHFLCKVRIVKEFRHLVHFTRRDYDQILQN